MTISRFRDGSDWPFKFAERSNLV